ncbi:Uncharacterised protein [Sphingobacterium daejeonense]|nr:Uncharacterised protein [Sphingobacterium daejeonense]HAP96102.1 hypothetical protein [Chryseobacterium sp.]
MEDIHTKIKDVEDWLRNNPHADKEARWEMVSRLREYNDELNAINKQKIENGLNLLNKGLSPLKHRL